MKELKRSNAPIFWMLFGAGGMMAAFFGVALVLITGVVVPLDWFHMGHAMDYAKMLAFAQSFVGKGFIFLVIFLFLWHSVHRVFHSLHEFGIHGGFIAKLCCYGLAFVGTLIEIYALLRIGFKGFI